MEMNGNTEGKRPWMMIHVIECAINGRIETMKSYVRKLADYYRKAGDEKFADCILSSIGEAEVAMAVMDDNSLNEDVEKVARFVRGHLAEIPDDVHDAFERVYKSVTGKKMYGGFKD